MTKVQSKTINIGSIGWASNKVYTFYGAHLMPRTGTVEAINPKREMVVVATQNDGVTIIEFISYLDLEISDTLTCENGYRLGLKVYENLSKN